ncbi:MAG: flagellar export protein FliJ [Lachnospiraceae bacterium]|nr:flagellar export protein FliJ [Lachnospiraceae bacterium]
MARFKYRMQNILDLKGKLETQARMQFANQQARVREAEDVRDGMLMKKEGYVQEIRDMQDKKLNMTDMKIASNGIKTMDYLIAQQEKVIDREKAELERRRSELESVVQERKAQEKLREKAFVEFLKEEAAAESKAIDELTSYTYGAKRGNDE